MAAIVLATSWPKALIVPAPVMTTRRLT